MRTSTLLHNSFARALVLLVALLLGAVGSTQAQPAERSGGAFYAKGGIGFSDYTGDFPFQNASHPFDLQELTRGSGFPYMGTVEAGYQLSPNLSVGLGFQAGNYPIVGYAGAGDGITDSYRYTPQLLARYTFGSAGQKVAPYVDGGANATFGGATSMGFGPSLGAGIDVLLSSSLSFYVESRFNLTVPDDGIDGASYSADGASAAATEGITGPFDSVNQLLGFGFTVRFATSTAPQVRAVSGPPETRTGRAVTFTATVNEGEADRPLTYRWDFGDGATASGATATHTFDRPGTYTVDFSARNPAGEARASTTITVTRPPSPTAPPRIASIDASPDSATVGETVRFTSTVEGDDVSTYEWAFGDGTSATGASAAHAYEQPGQYTVRLTAANEAGEDARSIPVQVRAAPETPRRTQTPSAAASDSSTKTHSAPWGIVVASMSTTEGASTIAERYRNRLGTATMPVEVVASSTDQGLRLRVVVGQFGSRAAARQALQTYRTQLPSGAWIVQR